MYVKYGKWINEIGQLRMKCDFRWICYWNSAKEKLDIDSNGQM